MTTVAWQSARITCYTMAIAFIVALLPEWIHLVVQSLSDSINLGNNDKQFSKIALIWHRRKRRITSHSFIAYGLIPHRYLSSEHWWFPSPPSVPEGTGIIARETKLQNNQKSVWNKATTDAIECKQILFEFTLTIVEPITMVSTSWMALRCLGSYVSVVKTGWKYTSTCNSMAFLYLHPCYGIECDAALRCRMFSLLGIQKYGLVDKQTIHTFGGNGDVITIQSGIVRFSTHAFAAHSFIYVAVARVCPSLSSNSQDTTKLYLYTQYTESNE